MIRIPEIAISWHSFNIDERINYKVKKITDINAISTLQTIKQSRAREIIMAPFFPAVGFH